MERRLRRDLSPALFPSWQATCRAFGAAMAQGPGLVVLVGEAGSGKSFTLLAFAAGVSAITAGLRTAEQPMDPDIDVDLVDDVDDAAVAHLAPFAGTRAITVRPPVVACVREAFPDARFVTMQPMTARDVRMMVEVRRPQMHLPAGMITSRALARFELHAVGNPRRLDDLLFRSVRLVAAVPVARVAPEHVEQAALQLSAEMPFKQDGLAFEDRDSVFDIMRRAQAGRPFAGAAPPRQRVARTTSMRPRGPAPPCAVPLPGVLGRPLPGSPPAIIRPSRPRPRKRGPHAARRAALATVPLAALALSVMLVQWRGLALWGGAPAQEAASAGRVSLPSAKPVTLKAIGPLARPAAAPPAAATPPAPPTATAPPVSSTAAAPPAPPVKLTAIEPPIRPVSTPPAAAQSVPPVTPAAVPATPARPPGPAPLGDPAEAARLLSLGKTLLAIDRAEDATALLQASAALGNTEAAAILAADEPHASRLRPAARGSSRAGKRSPEKPGRSTRHP